MRQFGEPGERTPVAADAAAALKAGLIEMAAALLFSMLAGALLFPVWAKPHPQLNPRCFANIKQIVLAALMYAEDNDGRLPDAARWPRQLLPYVRDRALYGCEKDHSGAAVSYAMASRYSGRRIGGTPGPRNGCSSSTPTAPGDRWPGTMAAVTAPTSTVMSSGSRASRSLMGLRQSPSPAFPRGCGTQSSPPRKVRVERSCGSSAPWPSTAGCGYRRCGRGSGRLGAGPD